MYNWEFHNLNSSNSIIKQVAGYEAQLGKTKCIKNLVGFEVLTVVPIKVQYWGFVTLFREGTVFGKNTPPPSS
jgi:hypothetical protein